MRRPVVLSLCCLPLALSGCLDTRATASIGAPGSSAATWQMPWQLNPISQRSIASGEQTVSSFVPGTGYVRGTPLALASIGHELPGVAGANRTVETCRQTVEGEARKLGAKQVEAVSAGPDRRNAKRQYVGPVLMRVTYQRGSDYEVREATLTCIVDTRGKIVDAFAANTDRTSGAS